MDTEGLWLVAALCAMPFLGYGVMELFIYYRRRRETAIAQRRKSSNWRQG